MSITLAKNTDYKPRLRSSFINIRVQDQDGDGFVFFRIKRSSPLQLLMDAYCVKKAADMGTFVFLLDGGKIHGSQTPLELKMEDGDVIDAMLHMLGGAPA